MKTIIFIGGINEKNEPRGGEEAKNQQIITFLNKNNVCLYVIDTYNWRKRIIVILWKLFYSICFISNKKIVISAHHFSVYKLLKAFYIFNISLKYDIHYFVIGGQFHSWLLNNLNKVQVYKSLKGIYVESNFMSNTLRQIGLSNASQIPNFKTIPTLVIHKQYNIIKFVFLSRILISKGVQLIIDSAIELSKEYKNFQVDFFGKVDEDYQSFHTQVKEYDFLHYKGFIDLRNEKNYEILASYNCMLFPTFWEGEGYAGVLVDAMIAQLPVIASNWNFNKEIINHNQNGWLISPKSKEELQNAMKEIIYNPEILRKFELETIKNISKYDISKAFFDIIKNS